MGRVILFIPPCPSRSSVAWLKSATQGQMPRRQFCRRLWSHRPSFHHLAAKLTSGIGRRVNICIPSARQQVGCLVLGNGCSPLDGTCHGPERENDSSVLS